MIGDRFILSIHAANARGKPVNPMDSDKNAAPIKISAIMAEVRVAPIKLSRRASHDKERWKAARISAPITPTAAASVAVAQPKYIEPITAKTKQSTGIRKRLSASMSLSDIDGSGSGRS